VTSYTITITPDDDSVTTTTLRLDTSGPVARVTDLHLHAGDGLTTGRVPAVDFGLLLHAVSPTTPTPIEAPAAPVAHIEAVAEERPQPAVGSDGRHDATPEAAPKTADAAPRKSTRARRATAVAKTPAATHKSTRGAKSVAAKGSTAKGSTAKGSTAKGSTAKSSTSKGGTAKSTGKAAAAKKTSTGSAQSERVYRRMPDDFATVYQQAGTAAAVADHYDVPRHTAHGWIRRLRDQGANATNR
jgi:hypothetical protein